MPLKKLDHINIRTSRLDTLVAFYKDALGLSAGWRPSFQFGGAWLYCGELAVVHLVEVAEQPDVGQPQLEHYAFRCDDLPAQEAALERLGVACDRRVVPDSGNVQLFLRDPDGNRIELQFDAGEAGTA